MSQVSAIEQEVKANAGRAMHYTEITANCLEKGTMTTRGLTPAATTNARMCESMIQFGIDSPYIRVGRGLYTYNDAENLPVDTPTEVPIGNINPRRIPVTTNKVVYDPRVRVYDMSRSCGKCERCGAVHYANTKIPINREIHHIVPSGGGFNGPDTVENTLILCPNCHAYLQHNWQGVAKEEVEQLLEMIKLPKRTE